MNTFQAKQTFGKPIRNYHQKPPWRVALIANLKDEFEADFEDPPDAGAEFDRLETIEEIAAALESDGHWVHFLRGDYTLPETLRNLRPQICFNIAEGLSGDGREAHVPALCELLGIPYTASRVVANAISLDKTRTKRIWRDHGLPTAPFEEYSSPPQHLEEWMNFPLFVKPAREGTGMGIDDGARVETLEELQERVEWVNRIYLQPALVEQYLPGREFTVGFLGNPGSSSRRRYPELYGEDGYHWFPILEIDSGQSVSPGIYGHSAKSYEIGEEGAPGYLCPADIPGELRQELIDLTRKASQSLDACDISRVDFRLDADGKPYLMEINTLPGLNSGISDICIMAAVEGMGYQTLITEILYLAAERYGMPLVPEREVWIDSSTLPALENQNLAEKSIPVIKSREVNY